MGQFSKMITQKIHTKTVVVALALVIFFALGYIHVGPKDREMLSAAIGRFHDLYNADNARTIWDEASPRMRVSGTEEGFDELLNRVRSKFGKVVSSYTTEYVTNRDSVSGVLFTLLQSTVFERDEVVERFKFVKVDDKALLLEYSIRREDFQTK